MVKDAEANAEADKQRRELADAKNHADALVHQIDGQMKEFGDKVGAAERQEIETALSDLKAVKDGEDLGEIQAKTQALTQAAMKLGEAIYRSSQNDAAAGPDGAHGEDAAASSDDVVDAEFEEVNDGPRN
jgi:molecular chaperone DnaK